MESHYQMKVALFILTLIAAAFADTENKYTYLSFSDNLMITNATNVIMETRKNIPESTASEIAFHLYDATSNLDIDFEYALAIMMVESRFNQYATSPCGAKGLMQMMPSTFKSIVKRHNLDYSVADMYDIRTNIIVGVLYLNMLQQKYRSYDVISAGYNGGQGNASRWHKGQYDSVPDETRKYVQKVKKYHQYYISRLNQST